MNVTAYIFRNASKCGNVISKGQNYCRYDMKCITSVLLIAPHTLLQEVIIMLPFVPCSQLREFLAAGEGDEQLIQVFHCCQIRGRSSREGGGGG